MPRIVFLHGLESGPQGTKAVWLAERYGAVTPALGCSAPLQPQMVTHALDVARAALREHAPPLVVASSFGGAVAGALASA